MSHNNIPRKAKHATTRWRCLGYGKEHTFESTGPGNRICETCKLKRRAALLSIRACGKPARD